MIADAQYPSTIVWPDQNFEATDTVLSLGITDEDLAPGNFIGWANFDKLPQAWHISAPGTYSDRVEFVDITRAENVDICILSGAAQGLITYIDRPYLYSYTNTWQNITRKPALNAMATGRLINKFDVNTNCFDLTYLQLAISIDGASEVSATLYPSNEDMYKKEFSAVLSSANMALFGGAAIPAGLEFTITQNDLDGELHLVDVSGHSIKYACVAFGTSGWARPITTAGTGGYYALPVPVAIVHNSAGRPYTVGGARFFNRFDSARSAGYAVDPRNGALIFAEADAYCNDPSDITVYGGYVGAIPLTVLGTVSGNYDIVTSDGCNFCAVGVGRSDRAMLMRMFAWSEIVTAMSMQMRYRNDNDNAYVTDDNSYYPIISASGEFLGELAKGSTDRAALRPWQIAGTTVDANTNTYTADDKPPYIPPASDDEKIGDSIGFNINLPGGTASGLYTMYALRQAHVNNLGAALWTSFNSPDSNFWQNVRMAAGLYEEAGSFDLSTILDFIASIRIYPFALINLPGYVGAGTGAIRMGTGKIPLDLSAGGAGNVGVMGSYTGIIDAGSVTIPAHYGDFRDLEGVTMSVYLPYIGNVTLNPAEVTGQTLQATYAVDLTSGACVVYLLLSGSWGYYPIGVYSGTIGADIPLTASQGNRMFLRDLKNVLGLGSILGGSLSGVDVTDGDALAGAIGSGLASGAAYMAKNVYRQGMGSALTPPTLGGGGANFAGFGAPQTAYVQIRRHLYAYTARNFPADQLGRRTYGVKVLGALSGFTVCDAVDVSGIPAPADIQTDIKKALESGVYL